MVSGQLDEQRVERRELEEIARKLEERRKEADAYEAEVMDVVERLRSRSRKLEGAEEEHGKREDALEAAREELEGRGAALRVKEEEAEKALAAAREELEAAKETAVEAERGRRACEAREARVRDAEHR